MTGATNNSPDPGRHDDAPVPRGDGIAAWRRIADVLRAEIRTGGLAVHEQLPTEARLALRFGVNRHTVRRALAALAGEGVVRAVQGRGTFVEPLPLPYRIGARTRFTENVLRSGHQAGGEFLSAAVEPALPDIAGRLRLPGGADVLRLRTRRFVDGVPVTLGTGYFPLPRFAGLAEARKATDGITAALKLLGITDYRRAHTTIGARPASAEEAELLELMPGRILLVVESVDVDLDGMPIEAGRTLFVAERVELEIGALD